MMSLYVRSIKKKKEANLIEQRIERWMMAREKNGGEYVGLKKYKFSVISYEDLMHNMVTMVNDTVL